MSTNTKRYTGDANGLLYRADKNLTERAVERIITSLEERHKDWPYLVRAIMWHEFAARRLHLEYYNEAYRKVTQHYTVSCMPLPALLELRILMSFVKHSYRRKKCCSDVDELEQLLFFLTHQIPGYKQFLSQYGCTWYTAYAYFTLAEATLVEGVLRERIKDEHVYFPLVLYDSLTEWQRWPDKRSLPLDISYNSTRFWDRREALLRRESHRKKNYMALLL
ncbi:ORF14 [Ranid herpesvirus 2]|uniref:ORF14 n=1 Tax=Ranid herpesvirus 2 TaxID=389214 RepID=Q14W92_9VIRU|nr:ORF14 [Ranid herpesvirus 2]ABG25672.1 ORF14 [Ranid herpesvirus 2]